MWALGCCIFFFYTKRDLFDGKNSEQSIRKIKEFKSFRDTPDWDPAFLGVRDEHDVVMLMIDFIMNPDPEKRPSAV